ncbi:MAG TPA: hypothetical protein VFF76_07295 [Holophagaceae bacterium]|jgi:hypothetical protein|nr:hypothetical protein [Holophagaceae bacterium]
MKASTLIALSAELAAARAKFPDPSFLTLALAEESGEAVKAALDFRQGKTESPDDLRRECIQAAAMAIRLLEEGDPALFNPAAMASIVYLEEPTVEIRVIEPAADGASESEVTGIVSEPPVPAQTPGMAPEPAPAVHPAAASMHAKVGA